MANVSKIRSKIDLIGSLNPKAWDALIPHTPFVFSNAHVELMVADVVKLVGASLADKQLATKTLSLSKKMAEVASSSLVSAWEPGDELCPPWPWPWPWPGPLTDPFGPHPEPWKVVVSAEQIELAHELTKLSGLTTSKDFNVALKGLATEIARSAVSRVAEEFERCGTVPRGPFPPRPH